MIQLAVIKTGGKQYIVTPGQKIRIEKIKKPISTSASAKATADKKATVGKKEDQEIVFDQVLLLEKGKKLEIGTPLVKGAKVIGKIISHGKGKKVIIFKYKPKTRYKVKKGHRQPFTEVEITKIESGI